MASTACVLNGSPQVIENRNLAKQNNAQPQMLAEFCNKNNLSSIASDPIMIYCSKIPLLLDWPLVTGSKNV